MDEKLLESSNLCVEIMNSKRKLKGKSWSRGTKFAFAVRSKRDA